MSKRILFSVFAAALSWSSVIVLAQEQAAAPSFKDGDTWQFNVTSKGRLRLAVKELLEFMTWYYHKVK
jgi:hypothetical protein